MLFSSASATTSRALRYRLPDRISPLRRPELVRFTAGTARCWYGRVKKPNSRGCEGESPFSGKCVGGGLMRRPVVPPPHPHAVTGRFALKLRSQVDRKGGNAGAREREMIGAEVMALPDRKSVV